MSARDEILAEVTTWLVKEAREFRAEGQTVQADTASLLASKVERGAVRPDNLRMLPADFFQRGHTYTRDHHGHRITFVVEHVSTAPSGSRRVAFGWKTAFGWPEEPFDSDDLDGWTDTAESGDVG